MIRNALLVYFLTISCVSCLAQTKQIVLYQNTGKIDRAYDVTEETFWNFKKYGDVDSLIIKDKTSFSDIYEDIRKTPFKKKPFLNPEYAIIIKMCTGKDTIYLNAKLNKGYSTEKFIFRDKDKVLLKYFKEKKFTTKYTEFLLNN